MGGEGSGEWTRLSAKSTVEDSFTLSVRDFRGRLKPGATGIFTWKTNGTKTGSVGYSVNVHSKLPICVVLLQYRCDSVEIRIPVRMQTTPTRFGGQRWWFSCPLTVKGVVCNRRVGKLHLPPVARYFGCRKCHRLTYRSCQEAHRSERMFGRLAQELGFDTEIGRLLALEFSGH